MGATELLYLGGVALSVAGLMLVRDEADIIEESVRHLCEQADAVYVLDNRSTDGTTEILRSLRQEGLPIRITHDPEVGYFQSRKMTALAADAYARGHKWALPCDADELWSGTAGTCREYLGSIGPDVQIVKAALYDYLPPAQGLDGLHPFDAITYRRKAPGALPKVAARLHPRLTIHAGNHGADYGEGAPVFAVGGLVIRHFTWRSPEQYLRKIRNGIEAYNATDLPRSTGEHWRMMEPHSDEEIVAHYDRWFTVPYPPDDETLIYDPVR